MDQNPDYDNGHDIALVYVATFSRSCKRVMAANLHGQLMVHNY